MLLLFLGCDGSLVHIDVEGSSQTVVEAGSLVEDLLVDFGFGDFVSMDLTAAQELKDQGVEPGDIVSATMTSFELEALDSQLDLAFLDSVSLSASAPDVDEVEMASCSSFPADTPIVAFELTGADIAPHIVSKDLTINVDVSGHRPDTDTTVEARYVVDVGVTAQGVTSAATSDQ